MSSAGSLHKAFSNPALDAERNPRLGLRGYRQTPSPRRPRHPAVPSRANPDSEAAEYSVTHINPRRNHPVTQQIEEQVTRVLATVVDTFHRRSDKPSRASMEAVKSWDSDGTFALAGEAQPALEIRLDPEERSFTSTPNGISKVRTYYLHQGGPEHAAPPMKLFLRLLDDDTVMVRVGGGWAELGEVRLPRLLLSFDRDVADRVISGFEVTPRTTRARLLRLQAGPTRRAVRPHRHGSLAAQRPVVPSGYSRRTRPPFRDTACLASHKPWPGRLERRPSALFKSRPGVLCSSTCPPWLRREPARVGARPCKSRHFRRIHPRNP